MEMVGLAYGYHSMLWGWVDTEREVADVMKPLRRVKHKRI